jgi:DNA-binding MarR family transcriptional regulator
MASKAEVFEVMAKLQAHNPLEVFRSIEEINSGMGYILLKLYNAKDEMFAIDLSQDMQISRARVTMLLRKLISRGLVVKQRSKIDARKEIITITNKGRENVTQIKHKILDDVNMIIDKLGFDKVNEFLDISNEIYETLQGQKHI